MGRVKVLQKTRSSRHANYEICTPITQLQCYHFIFLVKLTILERHYSYECKASSQERPYVSRPSRSQQLRNPKLVPKLTNDTPNPVEKKKGLADEILAKQEAQRTRLQELEGRDESDVAPSPNRRRSVSLESVSTVSTALSRRSRSPRSSRPLAAPKSQPRRRSPSYDHVQRDVSPRRSISRSLSPPVRRRRSPSRDSLSPRRSVSPESGKRRRSPSYDDVGRNVSPRRSISRSLSPAVRRSRMRSRDSLSPRGDSRERHYRNRAEDHVALPTAHSLRGHRAEDIEVIEVVEVAEVAEVVAVVEEVEEVAHRTTVEVEEIRTLKHRGSEV
ncbi:hypothetical protein E4U60_002524 [Claviceps pazoutovae]|uniref:Uncharacterized protein n=1 Tax=Claviceps pazoutovae TaxID=1649127 RepID=A0A9P7SG31_9HYPO|nr:hypothetical protein E4U60_002524 [Claviceps pazoutovae]